MKKTKILTVLGVLLAMGITACGGNTKKSSSATPSSSSTQPAPSSSSQAPTPSSSSSQTPSSSSQNPGPAGDPTGHNWGADADVAASGEGVAYKKASCSDNDGFLRLTINQSQVTYPSGSSRKSGTPEGYTKLNSNGNSMFVKFNYDSYAKGKLYLYGCMDGWSSNSTKNAFSYNGSPNIEVKVNGTALDIAALANVVYTDFLSGDGSELSDDGYACIGDITLHEGVNEISYKRLASMNTLIKDFVLVVKNEEHTHAFSDWKEDKAATCIDFGSKSRSCECGLVEQVDINTLAHDLDADTEVVKLNADNKKVSQFDCKVGKEKVAAIPMNQISGVFKTNAVEGEKEKWTIGDDANKAAADTYKMDKGTALLFKLSVSKDVNNAFISIGGKFTNNNPRHFYNHGDGGQNGDDPNGDAWRYYTKVNDGEFVPMSFNDLMSVVFGDGSQVCYMPLGKFNLKAGENLIYVRQSNLGYRVTLQGNLLIALGDATVSGDSPSHAHQAGNEWKSDASEHWHECVAAGCDEEGIKLDKAAHTFGDWAQDQAPTCTAAGSEKRACTVCGYEETRALPATHTWGTPETVAATGEKGAAGYKLGYTKSACTVDGCGAIKIEFKTLDGVFAKGGNKSGTADGYMKLNTNGDQMKWDFDLEVSGDNTGAVGIMYQRGFMDSFSSNLQKTYAWVSSSSDKTTDEGNFRVTANGAVVDKSAMMNVTFEEMTKNGDNTLFDESKNYSPVADCQIGQVSLNKGANTILYERLGSYNFAISDIVLIVKEVKHDHVAAAEWSSDENTHWHACAAAGCPVDGYKMDEAAHTFGDVEVVTPATHNAAGVGKKTCSVCGKVVEVALPKEAHSWSDGTAAANSDGKMVTPLSCECGKVGAKIDMADYSEGQPESGLKFKSGTDIVYKIVVSKAGNYELRLGAKCSNGNDGQKFTKTPYTLKVNGNDAVVVDKTYGQAGINASAINEFVFAESIALNEGENIITISQGSGGYRLTFGGNLVVCEL